MDPTQKEIRAAAAAVANARIRAAAGAIANARGNRRGVPTVLNILYMLPQKLVDEVMEDAEVALKAAAEVTPR